MRVFFCTDWLFRVSLKNSCNEKLLKVGVSEVGEIKKRAGKQVTHWNGFPENIIKFLSALSIPASKRPQLLIKHAWRHRRYQKLFFMSFKSLSINKHKWQQWDSNPQPVCKRTLNHLAKLAKWLSFVVSTYLYRADKTLQSINWVVSVATGFLPFNQTYTFFKLFSNFVHFCINFQIFCPFLLFLTFSWPFLPLLSKIARMPLLSMVGPAKKWPKHVNFVILYKKVSSVKLSIWWH